jgi:hypothetical protein
MPDGVAKGVETTGTSGRARWRTCRAIIRGDLPIRRGILIVPSIDQ